MKRFFMWGLIVVASSIISVSSYADGEGEGGGEGPSGSPVVIEGVRGSVFMYESTDFPTTSYYSYSSAMEVVKMYDSYGAYQSMTIGRGYMEFDLTPFLGMNVQIDSITSITITTPSVSWSIDSYPDGFYLYAMEDYEDGQFLGEEGEFNALSSNFKYVPFSSLDPFENTLQITLTGDEIQYVTDDIIAGNTYTGFMMILDDETSEGFSSITEGADFGHVEGSGLMTPFLTIEFDENYVPPAPVPEPVTVVMVLFGSIASIIRSRKRS